MTRQQVMVDRYTKVASAQLLQEILDFDQPKPSFAERYVDLASQITAPNAVLIDQMLDLIEELLCSWAHYHLWAQYETSRGKRRIGLTIKKEYIERKKIKWEIQSLLAAIDLQDPVAVLLSGVSPSTAAYHSLAACVEDASNQHPLNPWGKYLLGLIRLSEKTNAAERLSSECFLHAVLLLSSCSSREQKVLLLKSILRHCCL